jgi:fermentation-respiration switch protein FrsA (DUF1100 family)
VYDRAPYREPGCPGEADDALPVAGSVHYAEAARAAGDAVELVVVPGAGHMDFVDPASAAFGAFVSWLDRVVA